MTVRVKLQGQLINFKLTENLLVLPVKALEEQQASAPAQVLCDTIIAKQVLNKIFSSNVIVITNSRLDNTFLADIKSQTSCWDQKNKLLFNSPTKGCWVWFPEEYIYI